MPAKRSPNDPDLPLSEPSPTPFVGALNGFGKSILHTRLPSVPDADPRAVPAAAAVPAPAPPAETAVGGVVR